MTHPQNMGGGANLPINNPTLKAFIRYLHSLNCPNRKFERAHHTKIQSHLFVSSNGV